MARNTSIMLRNAVIYSVYVRNHSEEGTFRGVEKDLDRIRSLGTDIIWLMPIHPIGIKNKKGELGCPYAIRNYREVNPEYGTIEDFKQLVQEIHKKGMKCIIDVVYNHTSPDSYLAEHHPEYFYKKPEGTMGNKTADWGDVVDLDYSSRGLWDYQIDTLKLWAEIVDGFRCDVASLVPVDFWLRARAEVESVRPGCIWLAESVHPSFVKHNRDRKIEAYSDCELYQAFDICYDYDVKDHYDAYLQGRITLSRYIEMLNQQETIYPMNYIKLRFLENHDNKRAKAIIPSESDLFNWTAFMYFQKGTALVYAGQETENDHTPSLFDIDRVSWNTGKDISGLLKTLYLIKKDPLMAEGNYRLEADDKNDVVVGRYEQDGSALTGIFSLKSRACSVNVGLKDGKYKNLIDNVIIEIKDGMIRTDGKPIIIA